MWGDNKNESHNINIMTQYNRIMLGKGGMYANQCLNGGFIGADFDIQEDLTMPLVSIDDWREFNKRYIPVFLAVHPDKTKVAAGLACGMLWKIVKGLEVGTVVLCSDGTGVYNVGRITGGYYYVAGDILPHRRRVEWIGEINRSDMSDALKNSTGSTGTTCDVTQYAQEIESLLEAKKVSNTVVVNNPTVEDAVEFAMEKHLEDFLVKNWKNTPIGKKYDIFEEGGELVGEQYQTDTGPIDILAISKDKKTLLVIELKKGRASDVVVGQIQRYMGYVLEELAEADQTVKGVIIGLEADNKLKRALAVTQNIEFYRYQIDFKLSK